MFYRLSTLTLTSTLVTSTSTSTSTSTLSSASTFEDFIWALKDINFEVQQEEVLGIIGKNGTGKTKKSFVDTMFVMKYLSVKSFGV